jgi:hypothetical protein
MKARGIAISFISAWAACLAAHAGIYSGGLDDATNIYDAPVPGFVGPQGDGKSRLDDGAGGFFNPDNYVNPIFVSWADSVAAYSPASGVVASWSNPDAALGTVTGDNWDIVSLGDLSTSQISSGAVPGSLTLKFSKPIRNRSGADLVVFENGFISEGAFGVAGQITGELASVEVSSDGANFVRFPSWSQAPARVGAYGTVDSTNVFNLAGKHVNASGECWGTPFDLSQLFSDPLVANGTVDLNNINCVRMVDIPGDGTFKDSLGNPIFDAWLTYGSGGFDLEALGAISIDMTFAEWATQRNLAGANAEAASDPDADGLPNLLEYAFARLPDANDSIDPPVKLEVSGNRLRITFPRDERAMDLVYEVQASDDLSAWTTIAKSQNGQPVAGTNGYAPEITESSAGTIASVGVIRKVGVTDVVDLSDKNRRFLRVRVVKP